jgi:hypothetical protein
MKLFIFLYLLLLSFYSPLSAMEEGRDDAEAERIARVMARLEDQRKRQEEANKTVVNEALRVYEIINKNWTYPAFKAPIHVESSYWKCEAIVGKAEVGREIKTAAMPSLTFQGKIGELEKGLHDLINSPASVDCLIALGIVKIFCLKELLGEFFEEYATNLYKHLENDNGENKTNEFFYALPKPFIAWIVHLYPKSSCLLSG